MYFCGKLFICMVKGASAKQIFKDVKHAPKSKLQNIYEQNFYFTIIGFEPCICIYANGAGTAKRAGSHDKADEKRFRQIATDAHPG